MKPAQAAILVFDTALEALVPFKSVVEFFSESLVRSDTIDIEVEQGNYAQCFENLWHRLEV